MEEGKGDCKSRYFLEARELECQGEWRSALEKYKEGVNNGCGWCMWQLADEHGDGGRLQFDEQCCRSLLQKSFELGNPRAAASLKRYGGTSARDIVVNSDDFLAKYIAKIGDIYDREEFLRRAAIQGDYMAQYRLGHAKEYLSNFSRNVIVQGEAREWYRKSAEQGFRCAQFKHAAFFIKDCKYAEGVYWYKKAADQGYKDAIKHLVAQFLFEPCKNEAAAVYWDRRLPKPIIANEIIQKIECCQTVCMTLIAIKRFSPQSIALPKDIVIMLAQYLWKTREEYIWFEGNNPTAKRLKYNI